MQKQKEGRTMRGATLHSISRSYYFDFFGVTHVVVFGCDFAYLGVTKRPEPALCGCAFGFPAIIHLLSVSPDWGRVHPANAQNTASTTTSTVQHADQTQHVVVGVLS